MRTVIDGLMIASSLLLMSWVLVLGPSFEVGGDTVLAQAISLAYPVGDVVVVTIVLYVWLRARQMGGSPPLPLGLVGAGLVAFAFADSGFMYLTATESYASGNYIDIGWFLGYRADHARRPEAGVDCRRRARRGDRPPAGAARPLRRGRCGDGRDVGRAVPRGHDGGHRLLDANLRDPA